MSTRWRPNTCGCELIFDQGTDHPPTHLTRCHDHPDATGLEVWDENRLLNRTLGVMIEQTGVTPEAVDWHFKSEPGAKRKLHIKLARPSDDKPKLRAALSPEVVVDS